jgi:hypothetical protein
MDAEEIDLDISPASSVHSVDNALKRPAGPARRGTVSEKNVAEDHESIRELEEEEGVIGLSPAVPAGNQVSLDAVNKRTLSRRGSMSSVRSRRNQGSHRDVHVPESPLLQVPTAGLPGVHHHVGESASAAGTAEGSSSNAGNASVIVKVDAPPASVGSNLAADVAAADGKKANVTAEGDVEMTTFSKSTDVVLMVEEPDDTKPEEEEKKSLLPGDEGKEMGDPALEYDSDEDEEGLPDWIKDRRIIDDELEDTFDSSTFDEFKIWRGKKFGASFFSSLVGGGKMRQVGKFKGLIRLLDKNGKLIVGQRGRGERLSHMQLLKNPRPIELRARLYVLRGINLAPKDRYEPLSSPLVHGQEMGFT